MPHKNPDARRYGGPGSSHEDRGHPEKFLDEAEKPGPGAPTLFSRIGRRWGEG